MKVTTLLLLTFVAGTAAFKLTVKTYDGVGGCGGTATSSETMGVGCKDFGSTVGKLSGDSCSNYEYSTCDTCLVDMTNTGLQTCSSFYGPQHKVLLPMSLPSARPCPCL